MNGVELMLLCLSNTLLAAVGTILKFLIISSLEPESLTVSASEAGHPEGVQRLHQPDAGTYHQHVTLDVDRAALYPVHRWQLH